MAKFYAVRKGKTNGIFFTWDDCRAQVEGFKGAEYKSFKTLAEAEAYIYGKENTETIYEDTLCAYVDGSFDPATGRYGSGVVYVINDEVVDTQNKCAEHPDIVAMRNVAGEITASVMAMRYAVANDYKKIVIFHDYEGIAKWCRGEWKTEREGTRLYKMFYESLKPRLEVYFVKVDAHTGVRYNEMADKLANQALIEKEGIPGIRRKEEMEPWKRQD